MLVSVKPLVEPRGLAMGEYSERRVSAKDLLLVISQVHPPCDEI